MRNTLVFWYLLKDMSLILFYLFDPKLHKKLKRIGYR